MLEYLLFGTSHFSGILTCLVFLWWHRGIVTVVIERLMHCITRLVLLDFLGAFCELSGTPPPVIKKLPAQARQSRLVAYRNLPPPPRITGGLKV
jgi:hypothetical protein